MTRKRSQISEADFHAYADGKLEGKKKVLVEKYLAKHPYKAEEVAAWQEQNEALRALHGHVAQEAVPRRLRPHRIASEISSTYMGWQSIAASILLVALGCAMGWFGRDFLVDREYAGAPLVREAMTAHAVYAVEVRHPVEVRGDEEQHLVRWLSKRLQQPVKAPNLNPQGFHLVGGRLLPAATGPAAQFMYEDGSGQRITLFLTQNEKPHAAAFRFASDKKMNAFYWLDETVSYALVGEVSRDRLHILAREIYKQVSE